MNSRFLNPELGFPTLVYGHDIGIYQLPDSVVEPYRALAAGRLAGRAEEDAGLAMNSAANPTTLITESIQPALTERIAVFTNDVNVAGKYADLDQPTVELIAEPDEVRQAFLRLRQTHGWYSQIRAAWRILRRRDPATLVDPNGLDSLLAEVANAPDVLDDWRHIGQMTERGFIPAPWPGTAVNLRLSWLIRAGAHIWTPTTAEHSAAWTRYVPTTQRGVHPALAGAGTATAPNRGH